MNKYILTKQRAIIKLDTETLKVDSIGASYSADCIWLIEEDGVITYFDKEYEVKAGNVVMLMYQIGDEEHRDIIVIDNKDLTNHYERRKNTTKSKRSERKLKIVAVTVTVTVNVYLKVANYG